MLHIGESFGHFTPQTPQTLKTLSAGAIILYKSNILKSALCTVFHWSGRAAEQRSRKNATHLLGSLTPPREHHPPCSRTPRSPRSRSRAWRRAAAAPTASGSLSTTASASPGEGTRRAAARQKEGCMLGTNERERARERDDARALTSSIKYVAGVSPSTRAACSWWAPCTADDSIWALRWSLAHLMRHAMLT